MISCATIESPYYHPTAPGRRRNIQYAMLAQEWACRNGYAPYASHLIQTTHARYDADHGYPYAADDCDGKYEVLGRDEAIARSMALRSKMDVGLFFLDLGESSGMRAAREFLTKHKIECIDVFLANDPTFKDRIPAIGPKISRSDGTVTINDGSAQAYFKDGKVQFTVLTSSFNATVAQRVDAITTKDLTVSIHTPTLSFSIEDPTGVVSATISPLVNHGPPDTNRS